MYEIQYINSLVTDPQGDHEERISHSLYPLDVIKI